MSVKNFVGLAIIGELTLLLARFLNNGKFEPLWSDIPSLMVILFAVSPFGRLCYQWYKDGVLKKTGSLKE